MKIDRTVQINILEFLESFYPRDTPRDVWDKLLTIAGGSEEVLEANLYYLVQSGCIQKNCLCQTLGNNEHLFSDALIKITDTGLDYLANDGGITAFKNTVTVRFHADAVATLENYILQSAASPKEKSSLVAKLRQLSFSATEHLLKKLLDAVVLRSPEAFQLIEKALL